jgi:hypothetical protein
MAVPLPDFGVAWTCRSFGQSKHWPPSLHFRSISVGVARAARGERSVQIPIQLSNSKSSHGRHCEERSDKAIQRFPVAPDCFAEPVIGRAFARLVGSH